MNYGIYCYRDHLSRFGSPFPHTNDDTARRYFGYLCTQSNADIGFSPADYDLFRVGSFDDVSGVVSAVVPPEYICNGVDVYASK